MTSQTHQTQVNQVNQVQELRKICRLMMEQQESFFRRIADKLDALETDLILSFALEADNTNIQGGISDDQ